MKPTSHPTIPLTLSQRDTNPEMFIPLKTGTILDELLSTEGGLGKGTINLISGAPGAGKTLITCHILNLLQENGAKVLFVSAEMTPTDMQFYAQHFPMLKNIPILFQDPSSFSFYGDMVSTLKVGYNVVAVDSFHALHGIVNEELGVNRQEAERMILKLFNEHTEGNNEAHVHTSILALQQVTKQGKFVGSNSLKHAVTSMIELRLTDPDDITSDRYLEFTKHRRGTAGIRLYYEITDSEVRFDEKRYATDKRLRKMYKDDETFINNINQIITQTNEND